MWMTCRYVSCVVLCNIIIWVGNERMSQVTRKQSATAKVDMIVLGGARRIMNIYIHNGSRRILCMSEHENM